MAKPTNPKDSVQKLVLFFDFCSSTTILEDLLSSESEKLWRDLIITLKNFLLKEKKQLKFEIYKFIGDGWILLFDPGVDSLKLFDFLERLCKKHERIFKNKIKPVLSTEIQNTGITFGIEQGTLIRMVMNNRTEYLGRPLNLAARLQSAIKDRDPHPQGKVLISNSAYSSMKENLRGKYKVKRAERTLRNIFDGNVYLCKKLWLFQKPTIEPDIPTGDISEKSLKHKGINKIEFDLLKILSTGKYTYRSISGLKEESASDINLVDNAINELLAKKLIESRLMENKQKRYFISSKGRKILGELSEALIHFYQ